MVFCEPLCFYLLRLFKTTEQIQERYERRINLENVEYVIKTFRVCEIKEMILQCVIYTSAGIDHKNKNGLVFKGHQAFFYDSPKFEYKGINFLFCFK